MIQSISVPIILSAISFIIATFAASPLIIQFLIYRYSEAPLTIEFGPNTEDIDRTVWWRLDPEEFEERTDNQSYNPHHIRLNNLESGKDIYIDRLKFQFDGEPWNVDSQYEDAIHSISHSRFLMDPDWLHLKLGSEEKVDRILGTGFLPKGRGRGFSFPFEPSPYEVQIDIKAYTSVESYEFEIPVLGPLPRFYGRLRLKPVSKSVKIEAVLDEMYGAS